MDHEAIDRALEKVYNNLIAIHGLEGAEEVAKGLTTRLQTERKRRKELDDAEQRKENKSPGRNRLS